MSLQLQTNSAVESSTMPYRALCLPAVASVVVGVLSIPILIFWFSWFWAIVPLLGIVLGRRAIRIIHAAPSEWTGLGMAKLGIGLSAGLWALGYGWLIFARASEVPYGYQLVTYEMLQPDPSAPAMSIPQSALDLQDKKVFMKGFMQPRRQQTGIKEFILSPADGECPYCIPNPKKTEMVRVVLQGDLEAIYTTHQIGAGGRFQVNPQDPGGVPYTLEADVLR
jgi:hypothetical protein